MKQFKQYNRATVWRHRRSRKKGLLPAADIYVRLLPNHSEKKTWSKILE